MIVKRMALVVLGAVAVNAAVAHGRGTTSTTDWHGIARAADDTKQSRYQIGQMERVLEGAVEHGVANIRDRLQAVGPTELLISDNARARGFRLDGYGVFFDVVVPSLDTTVLWSIRTLDQNDLGLESALKALQTHIRNAGDVEPRTGAAAHRAADEPAPARASGRAGAACLRGPQRDRIGVRRQRSDRRRSRARRPDLLPIRTRPIGPR